MRPGGSVSRCARIDPFNSGVYPDSEIPMMGQNRGSMKILELSLEFSCT